MSKKYIWLVVWLFLPSSAVHAVLGQQVVKNTERGLWEKSKQITLHEELIIGKEIGEDSEMFGYIRGLAIDDEGRIFVADSYDLNISVFDAEGRFIREFGRKGQGPGEFQQLGGLCWCGKDNNLYVTDRGNHRIGRFSREGKYLGSLNDTLFNSSIEGICSLDDGRFVLTARIIGQNGTELKLLTTDFSFKEKLAELPVAFPSHTVGLDWAPSFSDVGTLHGKLVYFTSPSEYKIVILDPDLRKNTTILKSYPRMFIPQYVQGFYADFNSVETLLPLADMYVVGVQSTKIKDIPRFKTKKEFIEFTHTSDLKEWDLETAYQLDFFDKSFKFLTSMDISKNRRLAGRDSQGRLYFIEQDPYPRVVRCRLKFIDNE